MLQILDTAGQEEYTALRALWVREGEAFLIVYSISSRSSFSRTHLFHKQILRVHEEAAPFSKGPPIMLVGSQSDRVTEREVSIQEGHKLARELGMSFVEVSAKTALTLKSPCMMWFANLGVSGKKHTTMALAVCHLVFLSKRRSGGATKSPSSMRKGTQKKAGRSSCKGWCILQKLTMRKR